MRSKTGATNDPEEPQSDKSAKDAEEFTKLSSEQVVEKRVNTDKADNKKA